jgi:CheY-specific phosphatase CheX
VNIATPVSKILVLENDDRHVEAIKQFCLANNLVALKVRKNRLLSVLRTNIDLGAILLAENYAGSINETAEIALRVQTLRPELPILLRRDDTASLADVPEQLQRSVCRTFITENMETLKTAIDEYIFSVQYPNTLVRGIAEITETVLSQLFENLSIVCDTPMIVRDRIIFGEVFSLIPLESTWCRGYMMVQAEEDNFLQMLQRRQTSMQSFNFRDVNSQLGELTNLIWGSFKNRYIGDASALLNQQVQVPLIVNHKHQYISFGTESPQLCFTYQLTDDESGKSMKLIQRFVFNLSWAPEDFKESHADMEEVMSSGELELF